MEERFVKKCRDRTISFGDTWEDVVEFAIFIQSRKVIELNAQWEDPAPKSALPTIPSGIKPQNDSVSIDNSCARWITLMIKSNQFEEERKAEANSSGS